MVMPLAMSLYATQLAHQSTTALFGATTARQELANQVSGAESPQATHDVAQMDRALSLQGIQAQSNYLVAQAMLDSAQKLKQSNQKLAERLRENGALFV